MLHNLVAAFVALIISATGVLAHDVGALAKALGNIQLPTLPTSVAHAPTPRHFQTAAAASATSTDTSSNSPNNQNRTTQHFPSLSSGQYSSPSNQHSSPGASSTVVASGATTNKLPADPWRGRVLGSAT